MIFCQELNYAIFAPETILELKKHLLLPTIVASLSLSGQNGMNVYPFLNIPVSARQAALGGDAVSVRDYDVDFAAVNPSLLAADMDSRISLNYSSYLAGANFGTLAYAKDLQYGHLISAGVRYMDYGRMPRADESGTVSGEFGASDAAISLGYAYQFEEEWTVGGSVSYITSRIDNFSSMAVAGTGGITYHRRQSQETATLVARNFGYQIKTFNGERERLSFRIDLGYTKIFKEFPIAVTLTAHDLQKFDISQSESNLGQKVGFTRKIADHLSFGAELFPEQAFNLRVGYNVKRGNQLAVEDQRSFTGLSAGFGIKISWLRFDYAHVRYHNAANMNLFGLMLDLTELGGNRR